MFGFIPKNKQRGMDDVIKKTMREKLASMFITKKDLAYVGNKKSCEQVNPLNILKNLEIADNGNGRANN